MRYLICCIIAYLIGSLSFSIIISRLFLHDDVRSSGSGNAGATNMARLYGMLPGILTLALDAFKQIAAMLIGRLLCGEYGFCLAGLFCEIGHCYPVFFSFRGGKGVACAAALAFMCSWKVGLCALIIFVICAVLSRKVSLSSILACIVAELSAILLNLPAPRLALISFVVVLTVLRHSENISRLLRCREKSFRPRRMKRPQ